MTTVNCGWFTVCWEASSGGGGGYGVTRKSLNGVPLWSVSCDSGRENANQQEWPPVTGLAVQQGWKQDIQPHDKDSPFCLAERHIGLLTRISNSIDRSYIARSTHAYNNASMVRVPTFAPLTPRNGCGVRNGSVWKTQNYIQCPKYQCRKTTVRNTQGCGDGISHLALCPQSII